jgi:serine/threonine protein phosphatase PrpC
MQQSNSERDTVAIVHEDPPEAEQGADMASVELDLEVGLASDVGPTRKLNEDCADYRLPGDKALPQAKGAAFVVADGMGGHQAGDVASNQAVALVIEGYYADDATQPGDSLVRAIKAANRSLYEDALSDPAKSGMGTTLVAAIVLGRKVYVANVGDSRAYVIDQQGIVQITQDHSWVEEQVQAGLLTREQAGLHPQRNLITRALGSKPAVNVDLFEGELHAGQTLLLCSDGLSNPLSDQGMARIILAAPPAEAAQELIRQAAELGGDDNATALIVKASAPRAEVVQDSVETVVTSRPTGEEIPAVSQPGQPQSQAGFSLKERRWRGPAVVVAATVLLGLCAAIACLVGPEQLLGKQADVGPRIGPIVDHRLAGNSLEQAAAYLGYSGLAEILAAHEGQLDASSLGTVELWPSERWLLLVGPAQADRCSGRVCTFQVEMGDQIYSVSYQPVPDDQPRAGSRRVRVFGTVQGSCANGSACTGVVASHIERERSWLAWWRPRWEDIFHAGGAESPVWVYGIAAAGGLISPDDELGLEAGDRVLARGEWLEGEQLAEFDAAEVYVLERDRYVPASSQISPASLPTVTLEPTQTMNP